MSRSHSVLTSLVLLAVASAPMAAATVQVRPQAGPAWHGDFDGALALAARENRPLLVCFNADLGGESANHNMAHTVYRGAEFAAAVEDVVVVVASIDAHESEGACSRFGHVTCDEHQRVERQARKHLFGTIRDIVAPQHVLLYPDGSIAWHQQYEVSASELVRAIDAARRLVKKSPAVRQRAQLADFRKAISGAGSDGERYFELRTAFCHATPDAIVALVRKIRDRELAKRLISDLATFEPSHALPRLAALHEHHHDRHLRPELERMVAEGEARSAAVANGSPADAPVTGDADAGGAVGPNTPPAALGPAEEVRHVHFVDGVERSLTGSEKRVTVLLFFHHDVTGLRSLVQRWNDFADRVADQPVDVIGMCACIAPETELAKTREVGFAFPTANYLYEASVASYGIRSFPTAVVIDAAGHVVFNGDAYHAYERMTKRLLGTPGHRGLVSSR